MLYVQELKRDEMINTKFHYKSTEIGHNQNKYSHLISTEGHKIIYSTHWNNLKSNNQRNTVFSFLHLYNFLVLLLLLSTKAHVIYIYRSFYKKKLLP